MFTLTQDDMSYDTALHLSSQSREPKGYCYVDFADKREEVPVRIAIFLCIFWEIYRKLRYPISSEKLFFRKGRYNKSQYNKIMQEIYRDVFKEDGSEEYFGDVKEALWKAINNIDDFGTHELNEYHRTFSIADIAEISLDPKIAPLRDVDLNESLGTVIIKNNLQQAKEKILAILKERDAIKNNALCDFLEVDVLREQQLAQCITAHGLRTEVTDKIIRRPVEGSVLNGYKTIIDQAIENQSARKSVYMQTTAIRKSQYMGRQMALALSILQKLYKEHCGGDVLLPFKFTESNYKRCFGKIFIDPDTRLKVMLQETNFEKYLDKEILMHSPLTCRHTDGICFEDFGGLAPAHTPGLNIGISCATNFVSVVSQLILSAKHFDQAKPSVYNIPQDSTQFFRIKDGIYLSNALLKDIEDVEMGIFYTDIKGSSLSDIVHIDTEKGLSVPDHRFSEITALVFHNKKNGDIYEVPLKDGEKIPFLSREFLRYVKDHYSNTRKDTNLIWVNFDKDFKENPIPVLRSIIYNNSMMTCLDRISNFLERNQLSKYHNASYALRDFSEMVFENIQDSLNIVQLETILRGHMVTSRHDYSLPIVTDVEDVHFRKTEEIISERTISGQFAFEQHNKHLAKPSTFTRPKEQSVLDVFFDI